MAALFRLTPLIRHFSPATPSPVAGIKFPISFPISSYQLSYQHINKDKTELGYKPYIYPHPLATDETFPPKMNP